MLRSPRSSGRSVPQSVGRVLLPLTKERASKRHKLRFTLCGACVKDKKTVDGSAQKLVTSPCVWGQLVTPDPPLNLTVSSLIRFGTPHAISKWSSVDMQLPTLWI
jgi:hypothetical protein